MIRTTALALLLGGCAVGESTEQLALLDTSGVRHLPLVLSAGVRAHCIVFVTTDCPIANSYAPTIASLAAQFEDAPLRFSIVHVDPDVDAVAARAHASDYGLPAPILLDPEHALAHRLGVTITPEAAVVTSEGALAYRGRIDNWWGDIGRKRAAPSRHDLRDALDAVLAGRAVAEPRTEAIGCDLPALF